MHNRFKKKINLNQLIDLNQKQQQQEKSAAEMSVDSKMETSEIHVEMIEIDQENEGSCFLVGDEYSSREILSGCRTIGEDECDEEEEPCLYQLLYEKLIKYFGDIVYTLEACEAKQQNSMEDSPSIISSVTNTVSAFY